MPRRDVAATAIFGLSGVAGLGYQVAWTRMFSTGLGHELPGLLAVVTAFFVGLAVGGIALDRPISRSAVPGRWYAGLELLIGVWGLVVIAAGPWVNDLAARAIGPEPAALRQWLVAFLLPLVVLLPATAAMGGTLPAMERLASRLTGSGTTVAGLYAANTLGAMVGIVCTATLVIPAVGLRRTVALLALLNVACGLLVLLGPAAGERSRSGVEHRFSDPPRPAALAALLLGTGLLGIGYEVAGVRVVAQVLENTIYTYASTVAVFLLGTALGAAAWQRFGTTRHFAGPAAWLLAAVGLGVVLGTATMPATATIYEGVRGLAGAEPGRRAAASLLGELAVAAAVFGPATLAMGATFSHLLLAARRADGGIGLGAGLNTLGGALAPPLVGVLLIPGIGSRWTLAAIALGYVVLARLLPRDGLRSSHAVPAVAVVGGLLVLSPELVLVSPPEGMHFLPDGVREGVMATVSVAEDAQGQRVLKVNDQFNMGGTRYSFADRRQAHVPLLLHPDPREVLLLGVGSGVTAGAATLHGAARVTAVELVPEVVDFLPAFDPGNRLADIDRVVVADARRFVRTSTGSWDVIVADLFHPARDGAGSLYTREHYAAIRDRLTPGGIACQWLPLYQLDAPVAHTIARTFQDVFPDASAWIAAYNPETPMLGLIGSRADGDGSAPAGDGEQGVHPWTLAGTPDRPGSAWIQGVAAARGERLAAELVELALAGPLDLLGCHLLCPPALRAWAGPGLLNRDDLPRVTFEAPWYTYGTSESGLLRVEELLALPLDERFAIGGVLRGLPDAAAARDFLIARDTYLGSRVATSRGDIREGRARLLDSVAASPAFSTAYVVALEEAKALAERAAAGPSGDADHAAARALLEGLVERRPERPDALLALRRLRPRGGE